MSEYTDEHTGGSEDGVSLPDTTINSAGSEHGASLPDTAINSAGSEDGVTLSLTPVSAASAGTPSSYISAREDSESESSSGNVGYFAQRGITAGPKEDFASMFNRLAIREGWSKKQRNKHRTEAIVGELEVLYGTNNEKLEKWQELCRDVGIAPAPPSITQCKKALSKVYVNLVNLINHRRNRNVPLRLFPDYHAFRTWTLGGKNRSRIFPKKAAKAEGFIKALLRDLQLH